MNLLYCPYSTIKTQVEYILKILFFFLLIIGFLIYPKASLHVYAVVSEEPSTGGPAPVISNISVGNLTPASADISWNTNEEASSFVDYGISTDYTNIAGDGELTTYHFVQVTGLEPTTEYHFRVRSEDEQGNEVFSSDMVFATTPVQEELTEDTLDEVTTTTIEGVEDNEILPPVEVESELNKREGKFIVTITWKASQTKDVDYYVVYRSEGTRYNFKVLGTVASSKLSYSDDTVEESKTYFYLVKTRMGGDESRESNEVIVTVIKENEVEVEVESKTPIIFAMSNLVAFFVLLITWLIYTKGDNWLFKKVFKRKSKVLVKNSLSFQKS